MTGRPAGAAPGTRLPVLAAWLLVTSGGCDALRGPAPDPRPPNVLLVSLDTVRADRTTPYGASRDTTPSLARLAARGVVFEDAFSVANESAWSHAALFTGRYPSEVAEADYQTYAVPDDAVLVPEVLRAYGYQTAAFVAGGHVGAGFGFNQGYDTFRAPHGYASFWHTAPEARKWLSTADPGRPWFLFLHSYDAHRPYVKAGPFNHLYASGPGSPLAERLVADPELSEHVVGDVFLPDSPLHRFTHPSGEVIISTDTYRDLATRWRAQDGVAVAPADAQHIRDHYDGSLVYADLELGRFLAWADTQGLLRHTLIVVVSDHGEDLLDHHFLNHRTALTDSCVRVPLIVAGPGFPPGTRVPGMADLLSVAPTLYRAAGVRPPAGLRGVALQDRVSGLAPPLEEVFLEGVMDMTAIRTARSLLVAGNLPLAEPEYRERLRALPLTAARFELFDLERDPGQQVNRLVSPEGDALDVAASLRDRLVAWRGTVGTGTHTLDPTAVDPRDAEQLRRHGYWERDEGSGPSTAPASPAAPQ